MAGGRNGNRSSDKAPPYDDPSSNKATASEDPEYVTMDTLMQLLDQQKNYYEDLLRRQETAFLSFSPNDHRLNQQEGGLMSERATRA